MRRALTYKLLLITLPKTSRMALTPAASRINDAKTMSTPCSTPNLRSCMSFSETAGRSQSVPGRLQPLRDPRLPPFSISPRMKSEPIKCQNQRFQLNNKLKLL